MGLGEPRLLGCWLGHGADVAERAIPVDAGTRELATGEPRGRDGSVRAGSLAFRAATRLAGRRRDPGEGGGSSSHFVWWRSLLLVELMERWGEPREKREMKAVRPTTPKR